MQYIGFASYGAGDIIFKQGDTGEHFYIILSGAVDVSVYTDEETRVRPRQILFTLLYGQQPSQYVCGTHYTMWNTSTAFKPSCARSELCRQVMFLSVPCCFC